MALPSARGDLAVECGFERLAEVQEEILGERAECVMLSKGRRYAEGRTRTMISVMRRMATVGLVAAVAAAAARAEEPSDVPDTAALRAFHERVSAYAAVHRRLAAPLLPLEPSSSPQALAFDRKCLAAAIKAVRPGARQGDIFGSPVGELFLETIADVLRGRSAEALLAGLYEEHDTMSPYHPRVYDPYPDWGTHAMAAVLLHRLPALPEEVEYRLIDHDLVLWDVLADLIVDVLPDAIPRKPRHVAALLSTGPAPASPA